MATRKVAQTTRTSTPMKATATPKTATPTAGAKPKPSGIARPVIATTTGTASKKAKPSYR